MLGPVVVGLKVGEVDGSAVAKGTDVTVRDWCAAALAAFKIPVAVRFRASLPYTETGKVMKLELEREEKARRASTQTPTARS